MAARGELELPKPGDVLVGFRGSEERPHNMEPFFVQVCKDQGSASSLVCVYLDAVRVWIQPQAGANREEWMDHPRVHTSAPATQKGDTCRIHVDRRVEKGAPVYRLIHSVRDKITMRFLSEMEEVGGVYGFRYPPPTSITHLLD